ncbi:MAG: SCO family protein [Thioalkalispiraceae bacterium]|jgi:protein SCO1/2
MTRLKHKSPRYLFLFFSLCLIFSGCGQNKNAWSTKDISGLMPTLAFHLTEANRNKAVTAEDYRGKILLLYFGYMHCPDICPTTLKHLQNALAPLGQLASQVQVLFVSVDPDRDTLSELKSYTEFFGPQVVGLRGNQEALRKLTKRYRVTYGYDKPDDEGEYTVSHSSAVYVFDRRGDVRLMIRPDDSVVAISHDLKHLLTEHSDSNS